MSTTDFDKFDLEGLSLEEMEPVKKTEIPEDDIPVENDPVKVPEIKAKVVERAKPTEMPQATEGAIADAKETAKNSEGQMTCPKCELEQPKAEQCSGCGVYVKKALAMGQSKIQITSTKF